ncbi:MAG: DMT family transporter, partial [candidate division Zixibacteria bacterium]|nr:DMT family transporter [candidate division Zixibacteria bacterium]
MTTPSEYPTLSSRPPFWVFATAMIVLQTLGGICYPIAKYGLSIIEPYTFAFFRYILSSIVLLAMVYFKKREPRIERADWWKIIGLGAIIVPFNQTLFLVGQSLTGAGHGAFLFATTPIWVFVLAVLHLREKSTVRRAVGIAVATGGVMSIMWSGLADFGWEYLKGDLIIIVAVIAWAYYTIFGKMLVRKYGALRMTAYSLFFGAILYFPFG